MIIMKETNSNIESFFNVNKMDPFVGIKPIGNKEK